MAQVEIKNDSERLAIKNARLAMAFDKAQKGAVCSLVDNATGQEFAAADPEMRLFRIGVSAPGDTTGKPTWLTNRDAGEVRYAVEDQGGGKTAKLTFDRLGGKRLQVECTLAVDNDMVRWRFGVEGPESLILEEIEGPAMLLRAPLGKDSDDALVAGITKGGVYHRPSQWPAGRGIQANQPANLAAQFVCHYNTRSGFYCATQDSKGYPKTCIARRTKAGLEQVWQFHVFHDLSNRFDMSFDVAQTTFRAGKPDAPASWRDAADIYKAWALKQPWCAKTLVQRTDLPDWLKQGPAMVRFNRNWLAKPERVESWLKDYWQKHFPQAPLIVAFWGWEGVEPWISPHYFPPYPSEEGLKKYIQAVRDVGGHPFFWPSGYQWAIAFRKKPDGTFELDDRANFDKVGRPHAIIQRDGAFYAREYPWVYGGQNATLCRGDAWTRDWLNNIALELTKRGADLIQVDQVVGAGVPGGGRCYSREHGHPPGPGLWDADAFHEQLRTMHETCKALNPDIILGFEEPQELYLQQIGIQDYRDFEVLLKPSLPNVMPASVFGYLYHEFVPCFQSNPRGSDRFMMAYCLVTGQVPHVVPHWPVTPAPLLAGGGFEEWNKGVPDGWEHVKGYRNRDYNGVPYCDEAVKHGGRFSLRIENQKADDIVQVSQNIPIGNNGLAAGKTYRMRVWVKADQVAQPNAIGIGAFDNAFRPKGGWRIPLAENKDWKEAEVDMALPADALVLRVMLHVVGPCKVWLDDISIEEQGKDGAYRVAMGTGLPPGHDLAVQWVKLFHGEGRPYLHLGQMLHPPALLASRAKDRSGIELPAILHNAFRAPDGSEAVVAVNVTDTPQEGTLKWPDRGVPVKLKPWEATLIKK